MEAHAEYILDHIDALIPDWDKDEHLEPEWSEYELHVWVTEPGGTAENRAGQIPHPEVLVNFFHIPVMMDALYYNLKRHLVKPLRNFLKVHRAEAVARAVAVVLGYVRRTNPAFFTYRLGDDVAARLEEALIGLRNVATAAAERNARMRIVPIYRYRMPEATDVVELRSPKSARRF
jgi:hypothetical protein